VSGITPMSDSRDWEPTRKDCEICGVKLLFWEGWSYVGCHPPEPTNRCTECEGKHGLYAPIEPENLELFA
jgi:hypothetical protein